MRHARLVETGFQDGLRALVKVGVPVIERDRPPLHDRLNPLARLGFRPSDHPAQEMRNYVPERQTPTADIRRLVDQRRAQHGFD